MKLVTAGLCVSLTAACSPGPPPADLSAYPADLISDFAQLRPITIEINQDADPSVEAALRTTTRLLGPDGGIVPFTFSEGPPEHWQVFELVPEAPLAAGWHDLQLEVGEDVISKGFVRGLDGRLHARLNPASDPVVSFVEVCPAYGGEDPARITVAFSENVGAPYDPVRAPLTATVNGVAGYCPLDEDHVLPTRPREYPGHQWWTLSCDVTRALFGNLTITVSSDVQNNAGMMAHAFGQPEVPFAVTIDVSELSHRTGCIRWAPP